MLDNKSKLNVSMPVSRDLYSFRGQSAHSSMRLGKRGGGNLAIHMFARLKRGKVFSDEDF